MSEAKADAELFFDAIETLGSKLVLLKHGFETKGREIEEIEDPEERQDKQDARDRFVAHQSILFAWEFINSFPPWREAKLGFGLERILNTLTDIHQGREAGRWLDNTVPHRGPLPVAVQGARGRCAAIMEILMRTRSPKKSAEFILERLPAAALRALAGPRSTREVTWKTVGRWRNRVSAKNAKDGLELSAYRAQMAAPIAWTDAKLKRHLRQLGDSLKDQGFR